VSRSQLGLFFLSFHNVAQEKLDLATAALDHFYTLPYKTPVEEAVLLPEQNRFQRPVAGWARETKWGGNR